MKKTIVTVAALLALALANGASAGKAAPYFKGDIQEVLDRACNENKLLLISIGREICGRCQKFYALLDDGRLTLDEKKCTYLKLDIDDTEQREYFVSWFDPSDPRLPFVGVLDPNVCTGTCLTAACDLTALRGLLGNLAKPVAVPAAVPQPACTNSATQCTAKPSP